MLENRLLSDGSVYSAKAYSPTSALLGTDNRHIYLMSLCLTTDSKRVFYALVARKICNCSNVSKIYNLVQNKYKKSPAKGQGTFRFNNQTIIVRP